MDGLPFDERVDAIGKVFSESCADGTSLCGSCKSGVVMRRRNQNDPVVYCHAVSRTVPNDVVECTEYQSKKELSLYDMKQIAENVDPRVGVNDKSYR